MPPKTGRETGLPAVILDSESRTMLSSLLTRRKSQYEAEAVTQWARKRTGTLPRVFISDSNAAFGAALENLGLEKMVAHDVVNHCEGFRNPRDTIQTSWSGSGERSPSGMRTPRLGGFKTWGNTHQYCETFNVSAITSSAPTALLQSAENPLNPQKWRDSNIGVVGVHSSGG